MNINDGLFKVKFSRAVNGAVLDFKCEVCLEDALQLVADESIIKISVTKMTASQYFKKLLAGSSHCDYKTGGEDGESNDR